MFCGNQGSHSSRDVCIVLMEYLNDGGDDNGSCSRRNDCMVLMDYVDVDDQCSDRDR